MAPQLAPPSVLWNTPPQDAPRIEGARGLGVNHQGEDVSAGQPGVDGAPADASIRAQKHATHGRPRIERAGAHGINRQGLDDGVGQAGVDGAPTGAPIGALEHAPAVRPRIEGGRGLGVNRQGVDRSAFRSVADPRPALARGNASAARATKNYDGNEQRPPATAQQGTQNAGHRSRLSDHDYCRIRTSPPRSVRCLLSGLAWFTGPQGSSSSYRVRRNWVIPVRNEGEASENAVRTDTEAQSHAPGDPP